MCAQSLKAASCDSVVFVETGDNDEASDTESNHDCGTNSKWGSVRPSRRCKLGPLPSFAPSIAVSEPLGNFIDDVDVLHDDDHSPSVPMLWLQSREKIFPTSEIAKLAAITKAEKERQKSNKPLKNFYSKQLEFLESVTADREIIRLFEERVLCTPEPPENDVDDNGNNKKLQPPAPPTEMVDVSSVQGSDSPTLRRDARLATVTFVANLFLLVIKIIAAVLSGSLCVISSVVDSAVDLTSGFVVWICNRKIQRRNLYKFPRGRTRLEPLAIIIVSVVMGIASLQIIMESIQALANGDVKPDVRWPTIAIMVTTIVVKMVLMVLCYGFKSPSTLVLAQDQRNDCISNTVAILCAFIAHQYWPYIDPIGAIAVSLYICVTWYMTGVAHAAILSGRSASPEYINRILAICVDHHPEILKIDTIHAYYFGSKFLVEVDVVMDENLRLKSVHDISEPLQRKIEQLPYVERAFLHVDYEYEHRPQDEHKVV